MRVAQSFRDKYNILLQYFDRIQYGMNSGGQIVLTSCNINFFKQKQKGVASTGVCQVFKKGDCLEFKAEKFTLEVPRKRGLVRFTEITYTTYLYIVENNSGVYSISCKNTDPLNQKLYDILKTHIQIHEYFTLQPESQIRKTLMIELPIGEPGGKQIGATNDDKISEVGEGIGGVFGGISSFVDFDNVSRSTSMSINRFSVSTFGEGNISGWQRFKKKCSTINQKVNDAFKPFNNKCKQIAGGIGERFNHSENSFVKNVRQYSKKTEYALNSGYDKADAPRRVTYTQPNSSGMNPPPPPPPRSFPNEQRLNQRNSLL